MKLLKKKKPFSLNISHLAKKRFTQTFEKEIETIKKKFEIERRRGIKMLSKLGLPIPTVCAFLCT